MYDYTYTILKEAEMELAVLVMYARGVDRTDNVIEKIVVPTWDEETIKKEIILKAQVAFSFWNQLDSFVPSGNLDLSSKIEVPQSFTTDPIPVVDQENEDLVQTLTIGEDGTEVLSLTIAPKAIEHRKHNHKQKAQSDRYGYEELGITWTKSDGTQYVFLTKQEDQQRWATARVMANAGLRQPTSKWKCINHTGEVSFINLSNEEVIEISDAIFNHVQMCFDAEAAVNEKIDAEDFSSTFVDEFIAIAGITEEELPANTTPIDTP